jgi:hypothetical protein
MEESFDLPVIYNGEEVEFKMKFVMSGFVSRFHILVHDVELVFERDDEQNFRVINYTEAHAEIDPELFKAIIHSLEQISS